MNPARSSKYTILNLFKAMKAGVRRRPSWFFFVPMAALHRNIRTTAFWDAQAPWQQAWLAHCQYHRDIIPLVLQQARPGWQVLDIGAGSGVLALPLHQQGCQVTALEPSRGMRALLRQTLKENPPASISIDGRSWEEVPLSQLRGYDLMLACNSLHVTSLGFSRALAKIFRAAPQHVCIISETRFITSPPYQRSGAFQLRWQHHLGADSSIAYHSLSEVWEQFQHHWGRPPTAAEQAALKAELTYQDDHYWLKQQAHLTIWWWSKKAAQKREEGRPGSVIPFENPDIGN